MDERLAFGYGTSRDVSAKPVLGRADTPSAAAPADGAPVAGRERPDWAFRGLLLFTAVLYSRPQDTFAPLAPIPVAEIAAIVALAAMVAGRAMRGQPIVRLTAEVVAVAALGGVIVFTAPLSIWPGGAIGTFTDLYLKVILIFVLMVNTLTSPKRLERFTWVVVIASSYIAFRAAFDYARGFNLIENGRVQGAVGGMFQNPNDLALNMVSILPLAALLALSGRSIPARLLAAGGGFLMIAATIVSQSRSGFLGLAAMMILFAIYVGRKRPAFLAAACVALLLATPLVPASYWQRVSSIADDSRDATGSREARRILFGEAWDAFLSNPLTGVGAGNFKAYNPRGRLEPWQETHNVVLQVASELGILGTVVFLYLVWRAGFAARQSARLLRRATGVQRKRRAGQAPPPAPPAVVTAHEAAFLELHGAAMTAAVAGWFFSALFASVAYHWTFYYLLALAIAPREILLDRLAGRSVTDAAAAGGGVARKAPIAATVRV